MARYSKNLQLYHPEYNDVFLCPICRELFNITALNEPIVVDIAHVIPASVGGNIYTLTCKKCNSYSGTKYDKQIAIEKRIHDLKIGKTPRNVILKSEEGHRIQAQLCFVNGHMQLKSLPLEKNYLIASEFIEEAINQWDGFQFQMEIPESSPKFRNISLLHSGFLMMFKQFGYEYALSKNIERIRNIILNHELWDDSYRNAIVLPSNNSFNSEKLYNSVSIIIRPEEFQCLVIMLKRFDCQDQAGMVLLPSLFEKGRETYENVLRYGIIGKEINAKEIPNNNNNLNNPEMKCFLHNFCKKYTYQ